MIATAHHALANQYGLELRKFAINPGDTLPATDTVHVEVGVYCPRCQRTLGAHWRVPVKVWNTTGSAMDAIAFFRICFQAHREHCA
jgi:hypothetical protein